MLTKLRTLASLYRQAGFHWSAFRLAYAFRLRTGLIRLQMPMGEWSDYKDRLSDKPARRGAAVFFHSISSPTISWISRFAVDLSDRFLDGMPLYFSHQLVHTGISPDWHKDYFSEYVASPPMQVSKDKHWSQISDDANGDIKFIWELNRFTFVYNLAPAYVATHNEEYPEAFWNLIEDWAEHNPPNTGPNWMDGQEISLRLMAWTFGYHAFLSSPSTTSQRKENFIIYVAAQAERIYKNIGYAISTRSNHTISEAFGLWMVGLLFPELKQAEKYLSLGKQLLEQEARNQIFSDGSYSMYSLNYHRFILHIYLYAIKLGEINNSPFSVQLINSVAKSIEYLSQLIDPQTGEMPVYGSNDGALVLPFNYFDFNDYRPLLQLGSFITKGKRLFESGEWDEGLFWLCGSQSLNVEVDAPKQINQSFSNGGVYVLHGSQSKAVIRCTDFQSRPSHADQLHVDLWMNSQNIACDAGTYLYSGENPWRNGLAHTSAHNTVIVDSKDQMKMVSRFTWTDWAKGKVLQNKENVWQGQHDGYKPVTHKRTVMMLENDRWLVIDNLLANELHHYALHWLLNDFPFEQKDNSVLLDLKPLKYKIQVSILNGDAAFSIVRADLNSTRGWRSRYYGHKEPAISAMLETNQSQACFWTFFGFESDLLEIDGHSLKIKASDINSVINLDTLSLNTPL